MLPKVQAVFRLTREPELKYSGQGTPICKVGLACSEKYGEKETQLFIDATAFKKTAEILNQVQKGHRVFVVGKINTESWDSNGQKHSKTVMVIESFEFIEKRQPQQGGNDQGSYSPQQPSQQYNAPQQSYQPQQDHKAYQDKTHPGYKKQEMPQHNISEIDMDEVPFGYIGLQYPMSLHVV